MLGIIEVPLSTTSKNLVVICTNWSPVISPIYKAAGVNKAKLNIPMPKTTAIIISAIPIPRPGRGLFGLLVDVTLSEVFEIIIL
ncbi:TPA: hypothetical protein ACIQN7_005789 [Bacillus cereus]